MTMRDGERERGAMQLAPRLVRLCVGFWHKRKWPARLCDDDHDND